MKTLKCDLCEHQEQGETFEEWMNALKPHYADSHPEVMSDSSKTNQNMEQWMTENKNRFDSA